MNYNHWLKLLSCCKSGSNFSYNFLLRKKKTLLPKNNKFCRFISYISVAHPPIRKFIDLLEEKYSQSCSDKSNGSHIQAVSNFDKLPRSDEVNRILKEIMCTKRNLMALLELKSEKNKEMNLLIKEESKEFEDKLLDLESQLLEALLPADFENSFKSIILEVGAGVGGQEAMLFAAEIFQMYCNYVSFKGWQSEIIELSPSDLGGLRKACLAISGSDCNRFLRFEGGVHRVQRVPKTEKSGRIHTSTVTVAALPQPNAIDVLILDKDLKVETKRASGPGGQNVNVTDSAVRILHIPSGISVECQTARTQHKNKEFALKKLRALLYQKQKDEQDIKIITSRKSQVGSSGRSEKIRTYNFSQDRITDHRISKNFHNLKEFLEGGSLLDEMIHQVVGKYQMEQLETFLETISEK